jgi:hypothetical protein
MQPVIAVDQLYRGFASAWHRFMEDGRLAADPVDAFIPLFDTLNWATTLDERIATDLGTAGNPDWSWRDKYMDGAVVRGVRFARNRVHHQWADALYLDPEGAALPMVLPAGLFEWRWRRSLPPGANNQGEPQYQKLLAEAPARMTLMDIHKVFTQAVSA